MKQVIMTRQCHDHSAQTKLWYQENRLTIAMFNSKNIKLLITKLGHKVVKLFTCSTQPGINRDVHC